MTPLCIRNWDKWQSYRSDRGTPPWIKVHRVLFTNPDWATLTDAEKGQLVSLWIAAADNNGCVPDDSRVLRKICLLDSEPNVDKFISLGFINPRERQPDANPTPTRQPDDAPETETETETEKKQTSANYTPKFELFWEKYPRKKGKAKAFSLWKKHKCENGSFDVIMASLDKHITSKAWIKDGGQFIPHGSTWVNGKGWEDTPEEDVINCKMCRYDHDGVCRKSDEEKKTCKSFQPRTDI